MRSKDKIYERTIYDQYAGRILSLCRRYYISGYDIKDLHQECFIKLFSRLHKYDSNKGPFEPWMYRVCINRILEIQKVEKRMSDIVALKDEMEVVPLVRDAHEPDLSYDQLMDCLLQLPEGYRVVFSLFAIDGWSHDEIAQSLGISVGTSRSQYHRARKNLQQIINQLFAKRDGVRLARK